jgi:hypothetical protein
VLEHKNVRCCTDSVEGFEHPFDTNRFPTGFGWDDMSGGVVAPWNRPALPDVEVLGHNPAAVRLD